MRKTQVVEWFENFGFEGNILKMKKQQGHVVWLRDISMWKGCQSKNGNWRIWKGDSQACILRRRKPGRLNSINGFFTKDWDLSSDQWTSAKNLFPTPASNVLFKFCLSFPHLSINISHSKPSTCYTCIHWIIIPPLFPANKLKFW